MSGSCLDPVVDVHDTPQTAVTLDVGTQTDVLHLELESSEPVSGFTFTPASRSKAPPISDDECDPSPTGVDGFDNDLLSCDAWHETARAYIANTDAQSTEPDAAAPTPSAEDRLRQLPAPSASAVFPSDDDGGKGGGDDGGVPELTPALDAQTATSSPSAHDWPSRTYAFGLGPRDHPALPGGNGGYDEYHVLPDGGVERHGYGFYGGSVDGGDVKFDGRSESDGGSDEPIHVDPGHYDYGGDGYDDDGHGDDDDGHGYDDGNHDDGDDDHGNDDDVNGDDDYDSDGS